MQHCDLRSVSRSSQPTDGLTAQFLLVARKWINRQRRAGPRQMRFAVSRVMISFNNALPSLPPLPLPRTVGIPILGVPITPYLA